MNLLYENLKKKIVKFRKTFSLKYSMPKVKLDVFVQNSFFELFGLNLSRHANRVISLKEEEQSFTSKVFTY